MSKLHYSNNWENDIYTIGKKRVDTLDVVEINGVEYDVTARKVTVPYDDMGHTYTSTSTHYFVTAKVFGIPKEFDLNTLMQNLIITPIIYTVED